MQANLSLWHQAPHNRRLSIKCGRGGKSAMGPKAEAYSAP